MDHDPDGGAFGFEEGSNESKMIKMVGIALGALLLLYLLYWVYTNYIKMDHMAPGAQMQYYGVVPKYDNNVRFLADLAQPGRMPASGYSPDLGGIENLKYSVNQGLTNDQLYAEITKS